MPHAERPGGPVAAAQRREPAHRFGREDEAREPEHRALVVPGVFAPDIGADVSELVEMGEERYFRPPETRKPAPKNAGLGQRARRTCASREKICLSPGNGDRFGTSRAPHRRPRSRPPSRTVNRQYPSAGVASRLRHTGQH